MFEIKPLARGIAVAFGGLACAMVVAVPARAQTPAPAQKLDRVEVTGSNIRRAEGETALSVQVLKMDELQKVGVTTAEQAVQFIAENQSSTVSSSSVGASNGGAAYADLRGLGPQRTLVLLNGQRVVNNPYSQTAVDLNTIPTVGIERIEVLRDGASAIYGTDAIAGVINIITRKEYQGISVSADVKLPQASGGKAYSASIAGGYGSLAEQGWNIWGGFNYQKQDALAATERGFASTGIIPAKGVFRTSGTTFPAAWTQFDPVLEKNVAGGNPSLASGCAPSSSIPNAAKTACRYDFAQQVDLIPEQEIYSFLGRASLALGPNNTIGLEYFRTQNTLNTRVAPTPLVGLSWAANRPAEITGAPGFDPSLPATVNWRTTTAGQRSQQVENVTDRVLLNFEGAGAGWNYNAATYYSGSKVDQTFTNGYVNRSLITSGLNAGKLNPFGAQPDQAYLEAAKILGSVQKIEGNQYGINGTANREIFNLPAGPVALAIGAEYRREDIDFKNNFALIRQAASSGLELATDTSGDRNVWALMGELNIPIVKNLDATVAVRYDDYNDVGSAVSPKVALRYQPVSSTLLRASYNKGFRAPTLYDLYQPTQITNTGNAYNDPLLCPNGTPNAALGGLEGRDCDQQFNRRYEGNVQVKPEKSDSWSAGFVLDLTREVNFSLDYWNTKIKNQVLTLPDAEVFANAALNTPQYFKRCGALSPAEAAAIDVCSGNPNILAYVFTPTDNYGDIKASGLDIGFQFRPAASAYGRLSFQFNGTYVLDYKQQLSKGGTYYNPLGRYSAELDFPMFRWQHVASLSWQMDAWSANLFNRLKSSYSDQNDEGGLTSPVYAHNKVGAYSVWDLTGTWQGVKGLGVTAGVLNLFNEKPSFSNQGSTFQVGYDPRYTNPQGRTYMVKAAYSFK